MTYFLGSVRTMMWWGRAFLQNLSLVGSTVQPTGRNLARSVVPRESTGHLQERVDFQRDSFLTFFFSKSTEMTPSTALADTYIISRSGETM